MERFDDQPLRPRPHIAVFSGDKPGNFVVTTPLLRGLHEKYPGCVLDFFGGEITRDFEEACPYIDARCSLYGEGVHEDFFGHLGAFVAARRAVAGPYDLAINCDEFSELLTAKPEFIEMFVQIGRLGRSLGVHLLLASQRLEEGRLRGLETHLSYRIGLRTFSAMESRAVIGVPDAYELPAEPGNGYLRSSVTSITRFKAAYVSGPHRVRGARLQHQVIASQVDPQMRTEVR